MSRPSAVVAVKSLIEVPLVGSLCVYTYIHIYIYMYIYITCRCIYISGRVTHPLGSRGEVLDGGDAERPIRAQPLRVRPAVLDTRSERVGHTRGVLDTPQQCVGYSVTSTSRTHTLRSGHSEVCVGPRSSQDRAGRPRSTIASVGGDQI